MRLTPVHIKWLKAALHLAAFLPFLWLVLAVDQGWFSADPSKDIQHFTGRMTLKLLLATLMIAPLARYARQPLLIRCRRLVGLWCFARGTLHLISYSTLELGLSNLGLLGSELVNRPYLTLGILTADPAGAGGHLNAVGDAQTGRQMANVAQLRLSGGDPRPHPLPVVGQNVFPSRSSTRCWRWRCWACVTRNSAHGGAGSRGGARYCR